MRLLNTMSQAAAAMRRFGEASRPSQTDMARSAGSEAPFSSSTKVNESAASAAPSTGHRFENARTTASGDSVSTVLSAAQARRAYFANRVVFETADRMLEEAIEMGAKRRPETAYERAIAEREANEDRAAEERLAALRREVFAA